MDMMRVGIDGPFRMISPGAISSSSEAAPRLPARLRAAVVGLALVTSALLAVGARLTEPAGDEGRSGLRTVLAPSAVSLAPPFAAVATEAWLRLGVYELEPLRTRSEGVARDEPDAWAMIGEAFLAASETTPDMLPEAMYWLFGAQDRGSRRATAVLATVFATRCQHAVLRHHWICHEGE
jgi:hypothetical protein